MLPVAVAMAGEKVEESGLSQALQWDVGGSLRLRYEWKQGFALGAPGVTDPQDYLLSQLRLHLKVHQGDLWALFLEGQDARVNSAFIDNRVNDTKAPNIFADRFDLHQGYVEVARGDDFATHVRIGRQKFNLGAQRMVASLEWVNTARVWDGVRISQQLMPGRVLDLFGSQLVPVNPRRINSHALTGNRMFDSRFYGAYLTDKVTIPDSQFEFYTLLRRNRHVGDRVQTYGLRYAYKAASWDADTELMLQTGRFANLRHRAYAVHVGVGLVMLPKLHLGLAYNYGSGDSNPTDGTHGTFDNLYPLNHAYYGYMDLFSLQNIHNAESVLKWMPTKKTAVRLAWEGFWLAHAGSDAWYNAGAGVVRNSTTATNTYVGSEIDITVSTKLHNWPVNLLAGYSHFFAGGYVAQSGSSSDADFFFLQSKAIW